MSHSGLLAAIDSRIGKKGCRTIFLLRSKIVLTRLYVHELTSVEDFSNNVKQSWGLDALGCGVSIPLSDFVSFSTVVWPKKSPLGCPATPP